MKRILVLLAVLCLSLSAAVSAYNPYAPNQFDTMDRNTWEFQYLYDLTKEGITGADIQKFSPTYALTRYEMAQMVEVALQRRSKTTAAQQEKIDRLAKAFATDLQYTTPVQPAQTKTATSQDFDWKEGGQA